MPVVRSVRGLIEQRLQAWPMRPMLVEGEEDKFRAFKLAHAALAASGTVTLELAVAGTPMVVAYKVDAVMAPVLRRMIKARSIVLANLVLGENAFPEFIQEDCTPANLAKRWRRSSTAGPCARRRSPRWRRSRGTCSCREARPARPPPTSCCATPTAAAPFRADMGRARARRVGICLVGEGPQRCHSRKRGARRRESRGKLHRWRSGWMPARRCDWRA